MAKLSAEEIRDISERIYRKRLGNEDAQRMIEKDKDGGKKLRSRAGGYDSIVADVLEAIGMDEKV